MTGWLALAGLVQALTAAQGVGTSEQAPWQQSSMEGRVSMVAAATVRIVAYDDSAPGSPHSAGSGFAVAESGLIATCAHVVGIVTWPHPDTYSVRLFQHIDVIFNDGRKLSARVHERTSGPRFEKAFRRDLMVLKVDTTKLAPLPLGRFAEAKEGSSIYLCGHPFELAQPVVGTGILSTKWVDRNYLTAPVGGNEVAWLDVTMNSCNSGGPVLLVGHSPSDDRVIGLAEFSLNPYVAYAESLGQAVDEFGQGDVFLGSISLKGLGGMTSKSLSESSLGVGGCVSVDYLSQALR